MMQFAGRSNRNPKLHRSTARRLIDLVCRIPVKFLAECPDFQLGIQPPKNGELARFLVRLRPGKAVFVTACDLNFVIAPINSQ